MAKSANYSERLFLLFCCLSISDYVNDRIKNKKIKPHFYDYSTNHNRKFNGEICNTCHNCSGTRYLMLSLMLASKTKNETFLLGFFN